MSNRIRPSGAGQTTAPCPVENQSTVVAPPDPQPQETSSTKPSSNANAMRGDLGFSGQLNEMFLREGLPQAGPDPTATNSLRMKTLPAELERSNIPKNLREDLLKQLSNKSGTDLKQLLDKTDKALASKDPAGEVKSLVLQGKVDAAFESFNSTYEVNGKKVPATPHFRMIDGYSGAEGRTQGKYVMEDLTKKIQAYDKGKPKGEQLWNKDMQQAVLFVAMGKPSRNQVKMVTDALIKAGEFDKVKKNLAFMSDSEAIRRMQWENGIGIDCAGYVSQAFVATHGGTNEKYGLQNVSNENLMYLKSNSHFTQVKPTEVRPGDLITLDPPKPGSVGHTALVRDHRVMDPAELKALPNSSTFAKPTDKVHAYQVSASWGAESYGDLRGGVQNRTWLFNETTGKWE
jgi:hypothetical protein